MSLLRKNPFLLLLFVYHVSMADTQKVEININGNFSYQGTSCDIPKDKFNMVFGAVNNSVSIGGIASERQDILNFINCPDTLKTTMRFSTSAAKHSSTHFQTSNDAFGVKLKVNNQDIMPNGNKTITLEKNNASITLQTQLIKLADNQADEYGEHSFNITGNIEIVYP